MELTHSKVLGHADVSGFNFVAECLFTDPTAGINFDRIQEHPTRGYIIFEFLLCEERQGFGPHFSDPARYWHMNWRKFVKLGKIAFDLNSELYLVNYAKPGTRFQDEIKIIKVKSVSKEGGIIAHGVLKTTRRKFKEWFRRLNRECLSE
jgi:hypothetical protein